MAWEAYQPFSLGYNSLDHTPPASCSPIRQILPFQYLCVTITLMFIDLSHEAELQTWLTKTLEPMCAQFLAGPTVPIADCNPATA